MKDIFNKVQVQAIFLRNLSFVYNDDGISKFFVHFSKT